MANKSRKSEGQRRQTERLFERISALEKKASSQSMAAWLTALGTTLSGLGAVGLTLKPAVPAPPARASVQDSDHKPASGLQRPVVQEQAYFDPPSGSPPEMGHLVGALEDSKVMRDTFGYALRETELKPTIHWSLQDDPREALLTLSDPGQPEDLRAMSALYLGALADKKYEPLLKQVTSGDLVGKAAQIAVTMIEESAGRKRIAAKHSSIQTLDIPAR